MVTKFIFSSSLFLLLVATGCNQSVDKRNSASTPAAVGDVMSGEDQQALTPQEILNDLMEGNERFRNNKLIERNYPAQVEGTASGQYPKAIILSCVDSRVPVELIFDQGVGDIFVARVAGNVEDEDLLGSIEYAVGVAGSKLIMVLGHESCGAVKSAVDKLDVGSENVTHLLNQIEPAVNAQKDERNSKDKKYLTEVIQINVDMTVRDIKKRSQIVNRLITENKIMLVGAYYSLQDGKVTLLD